MPATEVVLADSVESLQRALELLEPLRVLGIDVERADWDRYYRAAALVQVGGDGRVALIDPLALPDLPALHDFMADRIAVFHALENDLQPIATLDVVPAEVHDTSIAASVLGLPTGLETLLRELIGVDLGADKQAMQRANWEARPLTPAMLDYAAGDVADLPALWTQLQHRLDETGRATWYEQELAAVLALPSVEARRAWTRTKGLGRLDAAARVRLQALWDVREELARSTDTAPGRIASDAVLIDLATTPPSKVTELGRRGVRRQAVRTFGSALIAALDSVDSAAAQPRRGVRPPTEADRANAEMLRRLRSQRAEELGIEAGVLCPNRMLMSALLADAATPADLDSALGLRPWQWEQLGAAFCEALDLQGPGRPAAVTAEARNTDDG